MGGKSKKNKVVMRIASFVAGIGLGLVVLGVGGYVYFKDRVLPGVRVGEVYVGGMTRLEAEGVLNSWVTSSSFEVSVGTGAEVVRKRVYELGDYKISDTLDQAFSIGRRGTFDIAKLWDGENVGWIFEANVNLDNTIALVAGRLDVASIQPSWEIDGETVIISAGAAGLEVDRSKARAEMVRLIEQGRGGHVEVSLVEVNPQLSDEEVRLNQARAENLLRSKVALRLDEGATYEEWKIDGETLLSFMAFPAGYDEVKVAGWVESLAGTVDREPQNALFQFEGGRVNAFSPGKDGLALDQQTLTAEIIRGLGEVGDEAGEKRFDLPVKRVGPKVATSDVNNLGIKEQIGVGKSTFRGSIANRIHNLTLASSRLNGVLVPPGEVFSFNGALGDVSKATGYKEAYVIEAGRTVLGDGGGVCQVSTTVFRAAMNAGLPIEERRAHAYRVSYYEQDSKPGLDATVFAPTTDFKFRNDTPGHILIQSSVDKKNSTLVFELYGTSDGRVATVSTPKITSQTPPPPDLYQDDPTIPTGTVKQVDWKAWGAKVNFEYRVVRGGEVLIEETFYSNYRPWQSVFLRGTGPVI